MTVLPTKKSLATFWYNLGHRPDGSTFFFPVHIFFFTTFVFGLFFVFFGSTDGVQASVLFAQSQLSLPDAVISGWGLCALLVSLGNTLSIGLRWYSTTVPMSGFLLWTYAFIIYALGGFWFQVFAGAVPNLLFWGWLYFRVYRVNSGHYDR